MKKLLVEVLQQFLEVQFTIKKVSELGVPTCSIKISDERNDDRAIWIIDDEVALLELVICETLFQK